MSLQLFNGAMLIRKTLFGLLGLLMFCIGNAAARQPMVLPVDKVPLVIMTRKGKVMYDVEVAQTRQQLESGLMLRTVFPSNRAMLFVFPTKKIVMMWMANTPLPLDMIFLNENGFIVSVAKNTTPYSTKIVSSQQPAAFTVELNAGEVNKNDIRIGQRAIHPAICGKCKMDQK